MAWDHLAHYFQSHTKARATDLHHKMMTVKQKPKEKIVEYLLRVHEMRIQLKECGETVSDSLAISASLAGIQQKFQSLAETLRCQGQLDWDIMCSRLIAAESRADAKEDQEEAKAFPHIGKTMSKGKKGIEEKRRCYTCGQKGHLKRDCPQGEAQKKTEGTALAMVGSNFSGTSWDTIGGDEMLLDTGASHHICSDIAMFDDVQTSPVATVSCGGGEQHRVMGKGTVCVNSPLGVVKLIDVLYVPTLCANLLSWPAASSRGAVLKGTGSILHVLVSERPVLTARKSRGIFLVEGTLQPATANAFAVDASVWHRRLGHVSDSVLSKMVTEDMVKGLGSPAGTSYISPGPICSASHWRRCATDALVGSLVMRKYTAPPSLTSKNMSRVVGPALAQNLRPGAAGHASGGSVAPQVGVRGCRGRGMGPSGPLLPKSYESKGN